MCDAAGAVTDAFSEISGCAASGSEYSTPVENSKLSVCFPPDNPPIIDKNGVCVGEAVKRSPA